MLDDDYPRDISVGFDTIPDHIDAAFALPAPGHNGREKVYFFKGTARPVLFTPGPFSKFVNKSQRYRVGS